MGDGDRKMVESRPLGVLSRAAEYASLLPLNLRSAESLYVGFGRFAIQSLFAPTKPRTVGQCVRGSTPLVFGSRGLKFFVRPETEDIGYLTPHHKSSVWRWFHPQRGEVVVDIGAHVGFFSILAGRVGCRVYAIEPLRSTFELLEASVRLNRLTTVEALNLAVGSHFETRPIHTRGEFTGLSTFKTDSSVEPVRGSRSEEVEIVPLDSITAIQVNPVIDWILLDTEGWVAEVLEGGRATLSRTKNMILEVEAGPNGSRCEKLLHGAGLTIVERVKQSEINEYWHCVANRR